MGVVLWSAILFFAATFTLVVALYRKGIARKGGMTLLFLPCVGGLLCAIGNMGRPSVYPHQMLLLAAWTGLVAVGIPVLYRADTANLSRKRR